MEVINKLAVQMRELIQSMTPGARISAGLLLAVVAVSLVLLFRPGMDVPDEYLFGAETFNGKQMALVQAALSKVGNEYRIEGNRVLVPRNKRDIYIAAVVDAGALPRDVGSIMTEALDNGSFLEPREAKKQRTQAARESQLSYLIGLMPWVDQASVILSIEEARGLRHSQPASATVSVMPLSGEVLDARRVDNLKRLVAGAHPSLSVDNVVITNLGDDSRANLDVCLKDPGNEMYKLRATIQQAKQEEISQLLSYIPGVRVEVSPILKDPVDKVVWEKDSLRSEVLIRSSDNTEESLQTTEDKGKELTLEANGPDRRSRSRKQSENKSSNTTEVNVARVSESELGRASYEDRTMIASIAVPRDYIVNLWKQLNPPAEGESPREPNDDELDLVQNIESNRIEKLVEPLLPRVGVDQDEFTQVHVSVMNSVDRVPLQEPAVASKAFVWAHRNWGALSMFGLAVLSFVVLRSIVRSDTKIETCDSVVSPNVHWEVTGLTGDDFRESEDLPCQRLSMQKSHALSEDLAEIVNEDPDSVARILKKWISNAA